VHRQDWFAVAVEVLIVVLGVVIGFQVTAWGNGQAARRDEQELLRGLRAEFLEVSEGIEAQVGKHRHVELAVAAVLRSLKQAEAAGAARTPVPDSTLAWALVPTTTQFSQGILSGTLVTGRLNLIRNLELRTALSDWNGVLADVTEDEFAARELVMKQLDPILWRGMDVSSFRRYAHHSGALPAAEAGAVSDVPVDLETIGALSARLYWQQHIVREFDGPAAEVQHILG
jgi:hypothetical protein